MRCTLKKSPSYSFAHKCSISLIDKSNKYEKSPAPNQYSPNFKNSSYNKHQPELKFNKSQRYLFKTASQSMFKTPGPGSYIKNNDSYNHILFKQSPKIMFAKSKKNNIFTRFLPGRTKLLPAFQYNMISIFDQNIKNKKGFKINLDKYKQKNLNMYPGPGQQQQLFTSNPSVIKFLKKNSPVPIIGKSKRDQLINSNTPSPSQYNIQNYKIQKGPQFIFPTQKRDFIFAKNSLPGPFDYFPDIIKCSLPKQPKYSFSKSHSTQTFYKARTNNRNRKFKIDTRQKAKVIENANAPSPGSYNVKELEKGPRWKFNQENRFGNKVEITPGPADYNLGHLFIGQLSK